LEPGSTLLGFSDGLVENRGEDLAAGLSRLGEVCLGRTDLTTEELCDLVVNEMTSGQPREDDVVVLAVRYLPDVSEEVDRSPGLDARWT
jgi:serine phosphatase RsbU (regulator of sigma subunit)